MVRWAYFLKLGNVVAVIANDGSTDEFSQGGAHRESLAQRDVGR